MRSRSMAHWFTGREVARKNMNNRFEWEGSAGDAWAAEWRRTDRSFGSLTEKLLARTREFRFLSVLDIGCGAGELSLAMARANSEAHVLGVDISARLVEASRSRAANLANVRFEVGDASTWIPDESFAPDLLISRHGVMFFADPVAAFAHLAAISAPGANLLFSCFRGPAENEIFSAIGRLLPRPETPPDPEAPGPMAFANPDRVRAILSAAGWSDVELEPYDFAMIAGAGEDPVEDALAYFSKIGPAANVLAESDEAARADLLARMREVLEAKAVDGLVALGAAAWIVTARRA
ncbi:MAG TPA: class I SAM-dependent methyltransferase [Sphingomonadaceae bacterium]|nr:class I SAM-dependent methyltransferase [Sphingomonadaceae bacterium]